jgi:hypothetical protein
MAIYHFDRNGVSPAAGSSAVKASAYISGATMFRELTAVECSYRRAERVVAHGVELPEAAPDEYRDPEACGTPPRRRIEATSATRTGRTWPCLGNSPKKTASSRC